MARHPDDLNAGDVAGYLLRLLREDDGGEGYVVELGVLDELIDDLRGPIGDQDATVRERGEAARSAAIALRDALRALAAG